MAYDSRSARLADHLPEYLIEALALGLFMVSAGLISTALEAPASGLRAAVADSGVRRALAGLAMGLTAIGLIYSPWGRRSGAHLNPAVTLAFLRLNKMHPLDALGYILAQFCGGLMGVFAVRLLLGADMAKLPLTPLEKFLSLLTAGLDEKSLGSPATESAVAAISARLFGPSSDPIAAAARGQTIRDVYASVIDSDRFRAACGRICASYAL